MPTDVLSRAFAALGDPTRRDIVARLSVADATVSELAVPYQMSLQAVYKHLRVLEQAGLVVRPTGPQPRAVRLATGSLDLIDAWIERYRRQAEQRYQRLDRVLAAMNDTSDTTGASETSGVSETSGPNDTAGTNRIIDRHEHEEPLS